MKRIAALVLGGVLLAQNGLAQDAPGDPQAGASKIGQCRTCHGSDGYAKIPIAPHIGGEPEAYIRNQLTAFRDGTRVHEMMTVVASGLGDQDIADLSAYYAAQTASATLKPGLDPGAAPEACVGCHGIDGLSLADDVPNLAGEATMYIDSQLKAFQRGKRVHEVMSDIAAGLSAEEIRAAAQWYSDVTLTIAPAEAN